MIRAYSERQSFYLMHFLNAFNAMRASKRSCFRSLCIHRIDRAVQRFADLAGRLIHDIGIGKLTSLPLQLEGLDAVI